MEVGVFKLQGHTNIESDDLVAEQSSNLSEIEFD